MRGIVRPCRHHLGPDLHARWQAHLCGLCLTLRDVAGQAERALTGYDVLLLSVLVEAQSDGVRTTTAGPCALRGFSSATVIGSDTGAARLAAAGALLSAGAGLTDKVDDEDLPGAARPAGRRLAAHLARRGTQLARTVGLDPAPVLEAPANASLAEQQALDLDGLLAPTGVAVAALFAHTAVVAGRPHNTDALRAAGDAFGRLVHLLDAVEDHAGDTAAGRFNPLAATGTPADDARRLADRLAADVERAVQRADLRDRGLVDVLLGKELRAAVTRGFPVQVPAQRSGVGGWATAVAALTLLAPAVFVGGSYGGGGCGSSRWRRRHRGGYDTYGYPAPRPGYGYRSVGPSFGQCLACNCCANLACNACCCGSECANG